MTNPWSTSHSVGKLKAVPLRSETRQGCPLSPLLFSTVLEVLATAIRQEIKGTQDGKEEVKPSLFSEDIIPYIESPYRLHQNLSELFNELSKGAGYEIEIHKFVVFLHISNELSEEIKKKEHEQKFC